MQIPVRKNVINRLFSYSVKYCYYFVSLHSIGYGITLTPVSAKPSNQVYSEVCPDNAISKSDERVRVFIVYSAQVYIIA